MVAGYFVSCKNLKYRRSNFSDLRSVFLTLLFDEHALFSVQSLGRIDKLDLSVEYSLAFVIDDDNPRDTFQSISCALAVSLYVEGKKIGKLSFR